MFVPKNDSRSWSAVPIQVESSSSKTHNEFSSKSQTQLFKSSLQKCLD